MSIIPHWQIGLPIITPVVIDCEKDCVENKVENKMAIKNLMALFIEIKIILNFCLYKINSQLLNYD